MISIKDKWITDKIGKRITEVFNSTETTAYTKNKFTWTDDQYDYVDWDLIGQVRNRITKTANVNISKLMYGWINVGSQKQHMMQQVEFPFCGAKKETVTHL